MEKLTVNQHTGHNVKSLFSHKTIGICIGLIALAIATLAVFKVSLGIVLLAAVVLTCPLIHIWIMKDIDHRHNYERG